MLHTVAYTFSRQETRQQTDCYSSPRYNNCNEQSAVGPKENLLLVRSFRNVKAHRLPLIIRRIFRYCAASRAHGLLMMLVTERRIVIARQKCVVVVVAT